MSIFSQEIEAVGIFIMTPYVSSGLSVLTENLRFSLPVCLCSINIPVYRLDFKSEAEVTEYLPNARPGLELVRKTKVGDQ